MTMNLSPRPASKIFFSIAAAKAATMVRVLPPPTGCMRPSPRIGNTASAGTPTSSDEPSAVGAGALRSMIGSASMDKLTKVYTTISAVSGTCDRRAALRVSSTCIARKWAR
jgi:hypothetical protein